MELVGVNFAPRHKCRSKRQSCRLGESISQAAREAWPDKKIPAEYHHLTKADYRTCERWASGALMSLEHFVALLHSDAGDQFLIAAMGDARPAWWLRQQRARRMALLRSDLEAQRAELAALEIEIAGPSKSRR